MYEIFSSGICSFIDYTIKKVLSVIAIVLVAIGLHKCFNSSKSGVLPEYLQGNITLLIILAIALAFITLGFVINRIKDGTNISLVVRKNTLTIKRTTGLIFEGLEIQSKPIPESTDQTVGIKFSRPVLTWLSDITIGKLEEKLLPKPTE